MITWIKSTAPVIFFLTGYVIRNWLSDEFTVTVHADPLVALVGEGVILSCQLKGRVPANVQVHLYKWERSKNMMLYSYNSTENGTEFGRAWDQHRRDAPEGRYANGNLIVKLSPVRVEDNGQYVCAVTGDGVYHEAITKVTVSGLGSAPRLTIEHQQNKSITLRCKSQGWYPQPEVRWTDSTGQKITAVAETRIQRDGEELYQIHSTLKLADIASDTISCIIINPLLKRHHEKVIAISGFFHVEAEYHIITAATGENAILPCRLITKHLPPSMELQWRKVGPGKDKTIYLYQYDESSPQLNSYLHSDKCPASYLSPNGHNSREWLRKEYEEKVDVFKGKEFGKGNISLKLNNIQMEDEGKYVCSATANWFHREIIIEVLVIGIGDKSLQMDQEEDVCRYRCTSGGWYLKPKVLWRNRSGKNITSKAETTLKKDEQKLFTAESSITLPCVTPEATCTIINTKLEISRESSTHQFGAGDEMSLQVDQQKVCRCECKWRGRYPKSIIFWRNHKGENITSLAKTIEVQDKQKLFTVASIIPVSCDTPKVTCALINPESITSQQSTAPHFGFLICFLLFIAVTLIICFLTKRKTQPQKDMAQPQKDMAELQKDMAQLQKDVDEMRKELEWKRARNTADDITLDAGTAHPNLSISGDKKSLKHEAQPQNVPQNPGRFDSTVCVLGSEGFSSGKHYWEVEVENSTDWDLGVARKSIERKGKISLSPKVGFWVLGRSGRDYWAKTDPWTRVTAQKKPKKIGVYLSHQDRRVTFFNVTDMSVLFTFNDCSFAEIYPFFKNSDKETTMRICSIKEE